MSILKTLSLTQKRTSDAEYVRLSMVCSHTCPNCEGNITVGEQETAGMCTDCYYTDTINLLH